ncbi:Putative zinc-finger [Clostridium cavendishii DSM 21758]|uniref:Putative zinc-finger n=1 Tax=Clostridium cavendishii DSM 21758 TaxID=1121302 RepID=A0A1M6CPH9_9CLOT|nr:zf-HC2 domain-containing protein [Clostridium cavendishii]SHI62942.1 Putative zinc-finger [Clostridium cavendishii DSM 21758]
MKCKEVEVLLLDFIEGNIASIEKQELLKHLEVCDDCKHMYEVLKSAKQDIKAEFDSDGFEYFDNTKEIMSKVDVNRYTSNKKNILRNLKKYKKTLISMAALLVIAFISISLIVKNGNFINMGQSVKENKDDIHSDIKNKWDVIYSDKDNIILRDFYKIKAYSKNRGVYFSIDLKKQGLSLTTKNDLITNVSKDGKLIYIFNNSDKSSMIVDVTNSKIHKLDSKIYKEEIEKLDEFDIEMFANSIRWSDNSRYLIFYNRENYILKEKDKLDRKENIYYIFDLNNLDDIKLNEIKLNLTNKEMGLTEKLGKVTRITNFNGKTVFQDKNGLLNINEYLGVNSLDKTNLHVTNNGDAVINKYIYRKGDYNTRVDIDDKFENIGDLNKYTTTVIDNDIYIALNNYKKDKVEIYKLDGGNLDKLIEKETRGTVLFLNDKNMKFNSDKLYLEEEIGDSRKSIISIELKSKELKETVLISTFNEYDLKIAKDGTKFIAYDDRLNESSGLILTDEDYKNLDLKNIGRGSFIDEDTLVFTQSNDNDDYDIFKLVSYNIKTKKYSTLYNSMKDSKIEFKTSNADYEDDIRLLLKNYSQNLITVKEVITEDKFKENIEFYDKRYKERLNSFLSKEALEYLTKNNHHLDYTGCSAKNNIYLSVSGDDIVNEKLVFSKENTFKEKKNLSLDYVIYIMSINRKENETHNNFLRETQKINLIKVNDKLMIDSIKVDEQNTSIK